MNRVVHFEIHANDVNRAQKFYESVFGWKFQDLGEAMNNYRLITTGEDLPGDKVPAIKGGMMLREAPVPVQGQGPNAYVCTIGVDNIDSYMAKAEAAGAKPQTHKMEVPGVGWLRYYKDPEGNIFGMLQPTMPSPPWVAGTVSR